MATPAMADPDPRPTTASDVTAAYQLAACDPNGPTSTDASLATQLNSSLRAKMRGYMSAYRVSCARMVVEAVHDRGLDPRAAVIAIATTIVETSIQNISEEVDHDSLGLFQQRASWGSRAQRLDPTWATNAFLNKMIKLYPNNSWKTAPIGEVCQAVQVSAYPSRYQPEAADAQLIVNAILPYVRGVPPEPEDATGEAADFDGDGRPDLLGTLSDGELRVYLGTGEPGSPSVTGSGAEIGSGWNPITRISVGDVDNDGKVDLLGRHSDGTLYAFLNASTVGSVNVRNRVTIGSGWNGITRVNMADIDNDGKVDVIGRNSEGVLYAYLNKGVPGAPDITTRVTIGSGWNGITRVNMADIDNDGKTDVIGRNSEGVLYAYLNKGTPGAPDITTRVTIGSGWNGISVVNVVDIDNDGKTDVVGRNSEGVLYAYLNKGAPGAPDITTRVTIGSGWNGANRLTVADIDNDDKPDIVARFADGTLNAYLNKGVPGAPDITTRVTIGSGWHIITRLAVIN
ncbi:VCBS repeat-containing protein [Nonomuraea sp. LP-02]|uniref:FG-GAP repeat domain-containing protein n=1 Tax=Nonomuraea sp. LP-02 TaxID=3097960 RepID=UPI002E33DF0B|nr:VCBS repeat-containing protein [Nonomuraea sp. LP-02]MED7924481.1 VCBS repeat-containing protein [Nonomuraea sp. LP-02]